LIRRIIRAARGKEPIRKNDDHVQAFQLKKGRDYMRVIFPAIRTAMAIFVMSLMGALVSAPKLSAQTDQQPAKPSNPSGQSGPTGQSGSTGSTQPAAAAPKPVDPEEEKLYKEIADTKPDDADKRLQLGQQYIDKYPNGKYSEPVYAEMTTAEYAKQDLPKMYADSEKALALNPDDVTVLVLVGWVIPHNYNPDDIGADQRLDKGEAYEKHALTVLASMQKPANLTDEQFAKAKAQGESQAHSGLGLIYFRRQNFDGSIEELKKATSDPANQDPTDYYVMGVEYNHQKKFSDAQDAFQKCAQIPGGLQDRCKQSAADAKKQASQPATK
jgi:tetratricopeptide (TPR) repeat protein